MHTKFTSSVLTIHCIWVLPPKYTPNSQCIVSVLGVWTLIHHLGFQQVVDAIGAVLKVWRAEMTAHVAAGLDEGLLSLTLSNLLYMENPYGYKKCQ